MGFAEGLSQDGSPDFITSGKQEALAVARKGDYQGKETKGVALIRGLCFSAMGLT